MLVLCLDRESWCTPPSLPSCFFFPLVFADVCREKERERVHQEGSEMKLVLRCMSSSWRWSQNKKNQSTASLLVVVFCSASTSSFLVLLVSWDCLENCFSLDFWTSLISSHLFFMAFSFPGCSFSLYFLSFPSSVSLDFKAKLFTISHLRDLFLGSSSSFFSSIVWSLMMHYRFFEGRDASKIIEIPSLVFLVSLHSHHSFPFTNSWTEDYFHWWAQQSLWICNTLISCSNFVSWNLRVTFWSFAMNWLTGAILLLQIIEIIWSRLIIAIDLSRHSTGCFPVST